MGLNKNTCIYRFCRNWYRLKVEIINKFSSSYSQFSLFMIICHSIREPWSNLSLLTFFRSGLRHFLIVFVQKQILLRFTVVLVYFKVEHINFTAESLSIRVFYYFELMSILVFLYSHCHWSSCLVPKWLRHFPHTYNQKIVSMTVRKLTKCTLQKHR